MELSLNFKNEIFLWLCPIAPGWAWHSIVICCEQCSPRKAALDFTISFYVEMWVNEKLITSLLELVSDIEI